MLNKQESITSAAFVFAYLIIAGFINVGSAEIERLLRIPKEIVIEKISIADSNFNAGVLWDWKLFQTEITCLKNWSLKRSAHSDN